MLINNFYLPNFWKPSSTRSPSPIWLRNVLLQPSSALGSARYPHLQTTLHNDLKRGARNMGGGYYINFLSQVIFAAFRNYRSIGKRLDDPFQVTRVFKCNKLYK